MSFNPEYFFPTLITNITSLNGGQFGVVKATDVYPAVDVTDVTQSPAGTTKPYQILQLVNYILGNLGLYVYTAVDAATTVNLNATYNNGISGVGATLTDASGSFAPFLPDGFALTVGERVIVKNQASPAQNGIYVLAVNGNGTNIPWQLTRSADFNQPSNIIDGGIVYVIYGNTQQNTYWQDTFTPPVTVGTTLINWALWSFAPTEFIWIDVTAVSVDATANSGYIADRSATPVQVVLPLTFNIGDTVIVMGNGTGGWSLIANAGQIIQFGSQATSVAGSINSDIQYGNIQVRGLIPGTTWEVTNVFGNPDII